MVFRSENFKLFQKRRKLEALKPPEPLGIDGNLSENWKKWWQRFDFIKQLLEFLKKKIKFKLQHLYTL